MPDKIQKFINALGEKQRNRLKQRLIALKESPFTGNDIKKLKGVNDLYRLRIGKIRVIFKVIDPIIEVVDIDYRGNIY